MATITTTMTPTTIRSAVLAHHAQIHTLSGAGNLTVESPEFAQSGSFEVYLKKPDTIFLKVEGPFGISIGSGLLTPTRFQFYNSLSNQLISGSMNAANMKRVLKVEVEFEQLIALFTGGSFAAGDQGEPSSISKAEESIVLNFDHVSGRHQYWIDPSTSLITKIFQYDLTGKPRVELRYANFRVVENSQLPAAVRIIQHNERRMMAVVFSAIVVNGPSETIELEVPVSAERITLR
ncbi:MAG: DUF4292 domain-containing protein [bacterium]